jgi:hypothetical protein
MKGWEWLGLTVVAGALLAELSGIKDALNQILKEASEANGFFREMRDSLRCIEESTEKIPDRPPRW